MMVIGAFSVSRRKQLSVVGECAHVHADTHAGGVGV